jgi:hypothetical protein
MEVALLVALIWQVIDFLRELTNFKTNKSAIITQATAWIGGVIGITAFAHAMLFSDKVFPGTTHALGTLDGGSLIFLGLSVASVASSAVDIKQAVDGSDSAKKPPLLAAGAPPA